MDKRRFILILALTGFRLLAQPALPGTNQMLAPIATAYSASWIYYTTDSVSGLGFLNGASIPYVMTASNSVVAYVNAATNGLVTGAITNGLATTNFVLSQNYATAAITNGLATIAYVNTVTNGLVTKTITNGLATVAYVNTVTNGLVTKTITNGLATVAYDNIGTNFVRTNSLAQLNNASNVLAGKIITNTASFNFLSPAINADAVLHTNLNQRAQLVGSAVLGNTTVADANITAVIFQGPVTNTFPMKVSLALGVITNTVPFNFPLNPNAVWYFTNISRGSVSYLTNVVVVGE